MKNHNEFIILLLAGLSDLKVSFVNIGNSEEIELYQLCALEKPEKGNFEELLSENMHV